MSNLRKTIEDLAANFALSVIDALRTASIDEVTAVGRGGVRLGKAGARQANGVDAGARGGRLGRRSATDIERMVEEIVALLQQNPDGMRAEQIREALAVQAKELPRPLADALAAGRIKKTGQKRATTYFVSDGSGGGGARRRGGRGRRRS